MKDELKLDLSSCMPIVRHPESGSGDCPKTAQKAGQTSDWKLSSKTATVGVNDPPQDFWQDEESGLFLTLADLEFITLA